MKNKTDREKLKLALCLALWAGLFSYFGQPYIHNNQDAVNIIVTVFSILAGFLIAVITLIGDPKSLPAGGWQVAQLGSVLTYNRLVRKKWLFKLYLITLFLIFCAILIKKPCPKLVIWFEYIYLYTGFIASVLSFKLPAALMELQEERIQNEINERRKKEGIEDD
ncbi:MULTISPECIES: hypothetical protein [unclassified Pseudoalteromonas]|uniref:hypothetical protein n=1 Tax=unclassified Pseudoalteromonas TaxID=194690 RepID=UPI00110A7484|nr:MULTISPECIES: hypothetical protein [unclassified Pseudoalteromonas]MCG9761637.1 hypothetical protein [Pseudoalteromonas sp. Isolate6]TMN39077.1 hypothetical protein CWC03_10310 [Pseudoalteromonas sp. S2755]